VNPLEDRLTPAQAIPRVMLDSAGLLSITGTARPDLVRVWRDGLDVVVTLSGRTGGEHRFNAAEVRRIAFRGGAGNDAFYNETVMTSTLEGGAGHDTLRGGTGRCPAGRRGDDLLRGGSGVTWPVAPVASPAISCSARTVSTVS
jgi:Ca2+-binding RTX toxin-like protein